MQRIEAIVAPSSAAATSRPVTADVDFSPHRAGGRDLKPNPAAEAAIRSQQTSETGSPYPAAAGVPGAPPPISHRCRPPRRSPHPPPRRGAQAVSGTARRHRTSRNSTTNYEVDKTVSHNQGRAGTIRRLALAVLVNQKQEAGKPKPVPLSRPKTADHRTGEGSRRLQRPARRHAEPANAPLYPRARRIRCRACRSGKTLPLATLKDIGRYVAALVVAWLVWTRLLKPLFRKLGEIELLKPVFDGRRTRRAAITAASTVSRPSSATPRRGAAGSENRGRP